MRKGDGRADLPAREGETLIEYLHRGAIHDGWLPADAPQPKPWRRKTDRRSYMERLDELFPKRQPVREPGQDDEIPVESEAL